jgi:hypothetical protein
MVLRQAATRRLFLNTTIAAGGGVLAQLTVFSPAAYSRRGSNRSAGISSAPFS